MRLRLPLTLSVFRHPGYGEYYIAQFVSNIGNQVQAVAQAWLAYRLTGSPELLGLVAFANQLPFMLLGPLAGAIADRYDRRRTMLITHGCAIVLSLGLAAATLTGSATPFLIVVVAALSGMVNAIDIPTRQALLREIVGLEDLPQAVALNLSMLNAARIIGPAVGSGLILWVGEGGCFATNGLSYAAVVLCLVRLRLQKLPPVASLPLWQAIGEGFSFVRHSPPLRLTLMISAVAGLFAMPYGSLLPVFADEVLKGGPATLGLLMSAAGAGAFAGALLLSFTRASGAQGPRIVIATIIFGLCIAGFAFSQLLGLALTAMLLTGLAQIVHTTAGTVNVQRHAPDALRGRALALFGMVQQGVPPFGALLAGLLAGHIGVTTTLILGGGLCAMTGLLFVRSRQSF